MNEERQNDHSAPVTSGKGSSEGLQLQYPYMAKVVTVVKQGDHIAVME
jgi:hypothetical protein